MIFLFFKHRGNTFVLNQICVCLSGLRQKEKRWFFNLVIFWRSVMLAWDPGGCSSLHTHMFNSHRRFLQASSSKRMRLRCGDNHTLSYINTQMKTQISILLNFWSAARRQRPIYYEFRMNSSFFFTPHGFLLWRNYVFFGCWRGLKDWKTFPHIGED